jgi:hypothetical protein
MDLGWTFPSPPPGSPHWRRPMQDAFYVGLILAVFVVSALFIPILRRN